MSDFQKELLLLFFRQHMTAEQRSKLMRELPLVYNAWTQRVIVTVNSAESGERLAPEP